MAPWSSAGSEPAAARPPAASPARLSPAWLPRALGSTPVPLLRGGGAGWAGRRGPGWLNRGPPCCLPRDSSPGKATRGSQPCRPPHGHCDGWGSQPFVRYWFVFCFPEQPLSAWRAPRPPSLHTPAHRPSPGEPGHCPCCPHLSLKPRACLLPASPLSVPESVKRPQDLEVVPCFSIPGVFGKTEKEENMPVNLMFLGCLIKRDKTARSSGLDWQVWAPTPSSLCAALPAELRQLLLPAPPPARDSGAPTAALSAAGAGCPPRLLSQDRLGPPAGRAPRLGGAGAGLLCCVLCA